MPLRLATDVSAGLMNCSYTHFRHIYGRNSLQQTRSLYFGVGPKTQTLHLEAVLHLFPKQKSCLLEPRGKLSTYACVCVFFIMTVSVSTNCYRCSIPVFLGFVNCPVCYRACCTEAPSAKTLHRAATTACFAPLNPAKPRSESPEARPAPVVSL